jgi:hypothetical protein
VADVDEVIGDYAKTDPALDTGRTHVAATVQTVATLQKTDAAFAAGAPLLGVAEPALLFELLALGALGGAIGDGDSFDAAGVGRRLVALGEEGSISGDQIRGCDAADFYARRSPVSANRSRWAARCRPRNA